MGEAETVDAPDDTLDQPPMGGKKKRNIILVVLAIIVVVLLLTAPLLYFWFQEDEIAIDGLFNDWANVPKFTDILEGQENADIDITEYAVKDNADSLNFYVKVKGRILGGEASSPGSDSMQIFLDTDRKSDSGYQVYGIGADYLINITGWGGEAYFTNLYRWTGPAGTDLVNFEARSDIKAATQLDKLEASVGLGKIGVSSRDTPVRVVMRTVDSKGHEDWTDAAANQFPPALGFKYLSGQSTNQFSLSAVGHHDNITLDRLRIRFEDYRGFPATGRATITVGGRSYPGTGPAQVSDVTFSPPLQFTPGVTQTFSVSTSLGGAFAVRPALLYSSDIDARAKHYPSVEVSVKPSPSYTYINTIAVPSKDIRIDGNFDDWLPFGIKGETTGNVRNRNLDADSVYPYATGNRNVDINGIQVKMTPTSGPSKLNFYVSTVGRILNGLVIDNPEFPKIQEPGMGPPAEPAENRYLEDRVIIFIDRDPTSNESLVTGAKVCPNNPLFGADIQIDIAGKFGRVIPALSTMSEFSGGAWRPSSTQPSAACDFHRLEVSVNLTSIGLDPDVTPSTYFFTTDWRGNYDDTQSYDNR